MMQAHFLKIVGDIFNKWNKNWNSDYLSWSGPNYNDCYV